MTHATPPPGTPSARTGWSRRLERAALWLERPINRFAGTAQLNPFYHTGTIAFFLLMVVGATGFYLFLFYQYGFDEAYGAVSRMEGQPIARFFRALHRYASGAAVVTTLLHAFRILFMERFRGPRWLAWLTGILMTGLLWLAGVTGYWLIADERAQLINEQFLGYLPNLAALRARFVAYLITAERTGVSWHLFLILMTVHVILFIILLISFWLHVRRLSRPRWLPAVHWSLGMAVVLVLGSAFFPVGMLAQADPLQLPSRLGFDPIFLFFLPVTGRPWAWLFWLVTGGGLLLAVALPWLSRGAPAGRRAPARVLAAACTGCTRCALDCPYDAIQMVDNEPDSEHKYLAVVDEAKCVACGICVGSCTDFAIAIDGQAPDHLWRTVDARLAAQDERALIFACERQAAHGLTGRSAAANVISVPCVGAIPPDLMVHALDAPGGRGAREVRVVGCPPDDCAYREGNLWSEARLTRERPPRLKRAYANVPITAVWLPPDQFDEAASQQFDSQTTNWLETRRILSLLTWKNLIPAFGMLGLVMLSQIFLTNIPFQPYANRPALIQAVLPDMAAVFGPFDGDPAAASAAARDYTLTLAVDGAVWLTEAYAGEDLVTGRGGPFFFEAELPPGEHELQLYFLAPNLRVTVYDQVVDLQSGQILRLTQAEPLPEDFCRGAACLP